MVAPLNNPYTKRRQRTRKGGKEVLGSEINICEKNLIKDQKK